eukprot:7900977-Lingulodinium_polyedra.AAC.1
MSRKHNLAVQGLLCHLPLGRCFVPQRVRCTQLRAMPAQRAQAPEQAHRDASPRNKSCDTP